MHRGAENPPVPTSLDCSLGSESYPTNVCCNYVDNFFVVSASLASSQRLPSLCVLHVTRASLWLLYGSVRLFVALGVVFPLFRDNDEYTGSCGWVANRSCLLQLKKLSIPTEGVIRWYDKACGTELDSD